MDTISRIWHASNEFRHGCSCILMPLSNGAHLMGKKQAILCRNQRERGESEGKHTGALSPHPGRRLLCLRVVFLLSVLTKQFSI